MDETSKPGLTIWIGYEDSDLIEIMAAVNSGTWSGTAGAYFTPEHLRSSSDRLLEWSRSPSGDCILDTDNEFPLGTVKLHFTHDKRGHVDCEANLRRCRSEAHNGERWQMTLVLRTEVALVERFARHLRSVADSRVGNAELECLR